MEDLHIPACFFKTGSRPEVERQTRGASDDGGA